MSEEQPTAVMGRPTVFSDQIATVILVRIAEGESLRAICRDEGMPDRSTVFRWLADPERKNFCDQYASAREYQADSLVEETLEIADDGSNDWMERRGEDGQGEGWRVNGEHIQRSRLRVDARKWFASKVAPKKYGDKQTTELTGPDGKPLEPFSRIENIIIDHRPQTDEVA